MENFSTSMLKSKSKKRSSSPPHSHAHAHPPPPSPSIESLDEKYEFTCAMFPNDCVCVADRLDSTDEDILDINASGLISDPDSSMTSMMSISSSSSSDIADCDVSTPDPEMDPAQGPSSTSIVNKASTPTLFRNIKFASPCFLSPIPVQNTINSATLTPNNTSIHGENATAPATDPLEMSEILENLFKLAELSDVKKYRLVCQMWNREACRTLQKYSYVYLRESDKYEDELEQFLDLLEAKRNARQISNVSSPNSSTVAASSPSSSAPVNLPSPFRKFYLKAALLQSKNVSRIIEDPDIQIFRLRLTSAPPPTVFGMPQYVDDSFQKRLHQLLEKNQTFLTRLTVVVKEGVSLEWPPQHLGHGSNSRSTSRSRSRSSSRSKGGNEKEKSKDKSTMEPCQKLIFPCLKELEIDEADSGPKTAHNLDFLASIITGASNLKRLYFNGSDDDLATSLLKKTSAHLSGSLHELHLKAFSNKILGALSGHTQGQGQNQGQGQDQCVVKLPKLTYLNVDDRARGDNETAFTSDALQKVVRNFSSSLEDLSIFWPSSTPDITFPFCPKLERLCIEGFNGSLGLFNKTRVPNLKHLIVYDIEVSDSILDPHDKVKSLELESDFRNEPFDFEVDEENCYFLQYISLQYPNLDALYLTCSISEGMMFTIIRHLSQLSVLDIITESGLAEVVFTGINKHILERTVRVEHLDPEAVENLPRQSCLKDLKKLKTLSLLGFDRNSVRNIGITNNAIQYGLSKIPTLGYLRINWTVGLSPIVVGTCLSHVKKLVINNPDFKPAEQLMELWEMLPQVIFEPSNPYFK